MAGSGSTSDTVKERAARKLWARNENGGVDDVLAWSQLDEDVQEDWLKDVDLVIETLHEGD